MAQISGKATKYGKNLIKEIKVTKYKKWAKYRTENELNNRNKKHLENSNGRNWKWRSVYKKYRMVTTEKRESASKILEYKKQ